MAKTNNIKLHNIENVIPFVITDKALDVWLFFETENLVKQYREDKTDEKVKAYYLSALKQMNYPVDYLDYVSFMVDSHENVESNFEGNYFYRLR